ncbi:hypothetical protein [Ramlibacter sp. Leaf400]|uniref:hypothetical protein n=1 Tax=Ramlibacter sp. Leaf400 TaxID=1736365 RepID=UPI001F2A3A3E|nr:hypothetical protein [Ramlibacter sp. Leaf400]
MRRMDCSHRGRLSPVRWGAMVLGFVAGGCLAQSPGDPPLPQLSLTLVAPIASQRPAPAGQDVALQWRQPLGGDRTIDISAWKRVAPPEPDALRMIQDREPLFGARLEMRIANRKSFATELRAIGLQLDNGARIMLRRKDGNPTLYYRQQF